jgi:pimeloyl-ACP methyl ester carboxylesterase
VAVSSPARWYYRGTAPMRRLHWVVTRPTGRLVSRLGLRTRIHPDEWDPVPPSPVESVPYIAPAPLLIVHGDRDTYFPLDHPLALAEAAGDGAELWIERGFGHAENAADPALLTRIGEWLTARVPGI